MRYALVAGVIVGTVLPHAAAGQSLGPRTLLPLQIACADLEPLCGAGLDDGDITRPQ